MTMSSTPGCCRVSEPFRKEAEFSLYSTDSENQVCDSFAHTIDDRASHSNIIGGGGSPCTNVDSRARLDEKIVWERDYVLCTC